MQDLLPRTLKIAKKPWGLEEIWGSVEGKYLGKTITINEGHQLSRQFHKEKEESIYVIRGSLKLEIGWENGEPEIIYVMNPGDFFHIQPGLIHRFCAHEGAVALCEVSTYYPDDVVRLEDDYGR